MLRQARPLRTLTGGHTGYVDSVSFSPNGNTIASGSGGSTAIHLWDTDTGNHLRTLTGDRGCGWSVSFSPDGNTLASGSGNDIRLWDADTGNHLRTFRGHTEWVLSVSFSPDGNTLASGSWDEVRVWDANTGGLLLAITGSAGWQSVALSPDGNTLAHGSGTSTVHLWDVATGRRLHTLIGIVYGVDSVAFSPDGQTLAGVDNSGTVHLWDVATGSRLHTLGGRTGHTILRIESVAFSPDGNTIASGGEDGTIRLWDANTRENLRTLTGHTDNVISVAFNPDGNTIASGSYDGTVLLWEITPTSPHPGENAADVNGDGEVNIQDLVAVAAALGQTGENAADVNGDDEVNIQDLVAVAAALGEVAAAPAALRQEVTAELTAAEVQHWITQAQQLDLTVPTTQRGILFLQHLLAVLTPQETILLANYPNPFNPETWIPYQLAKPAEVTLTIYDTNGRVVRDLDLGHQPVGTYQAKSRAAYWDGRNAVGEPVASGVYFYTLKAGDFTATRKMLIRK